MPFKHSANEYSREKFCHISSTLCAIFIATQHICKDFSANFAPFLVKYAIVYYTPAIINLLCEFGVIWI